MLHNQQLGAFYPNSSVSLLNFSFEEYRKNALKYFTTMRASNSNIPAGILSDNVENPDLDEIQLPLTRAHELDHYLLMNSTPFGLLIWRMYMAISTGVSYLLRKTEDYIDDSFFLPIHEWYLKSACHRMDKNMHVLMRLPVDVVASLDLRVLPHFSRLLLGKEKITMRRFIDIANAAFKILSTRGGLQTELEWTAHNPGRESYLPDEGFSTTEIIEANARVKELFMLNHAGFSKKQIEQWRKRSIFGVYKPVFDWIMDELGNDIFIRIAIEQALITPIDLSCYAGYKGKIYVEDVLPAWRLQKVVKSMQSFVWNMKDRESVNSLLLEQICAKANIPTPKTTLENLLQTPIKGKVGWEGDLIFQPENSRLSLNEYYQYTEDEFLKMFRVRLQNYYLHILPDKPFLFEPLFELYENYAHAPHSRFENEDFEIRYSQTFYKIITDIVNLSLIGNGDIRILKNIVKSFMDGQMTPEGEDLLNNYPIIRKLKDHLIWDI